MSVESLRMMDVMSEMFGALAPMRDAQVTCWELKNKLKAFGLFQYVETMVETSGSLVQAVEGARLLGDFLTPWAWEGLGHAYTERKWDDESSLQGLLNGSDAATLPQECLVPLHVGMGLVFAEHLLPALNRTATDEEIDGFLDRYRTLCHSNAHPNFVQASMETMGLVVATIYPTLLPALSRRISRVDPSVRALLWHGFGRGSYFSTHSLLPLPHATWRTWCSLGEIAGTDEERQNAQAGLIWALVLVNLESPDVFAAFLTEHAVILAKDPAFRNGLTSAIMLWDEMTPCSPTLERFLAFQPTTQKDLWFKAVTLPCRHALAHEAPTFKATNRFADLFRYRAPQSES